VQFEDERQVLARTLVIATGAQYRRLPLDDLHLYEGSSVFYAAAPPDVRRCAGQAVCVVGGDNSAGQAAVWLARQNATVTLLHRRADLGETMSHYLIQELDRASVIVRDRSEIQALHGGRGQLEAVTLADGKYLPCANLFLFLGAKPCTEWLEGVVDRDDDGFILTGAACGVGHELETTMPGLFAVGDARAGSTKRCATAAGEGARAVRLVHSHLAQN
jgi:thioredoxin reductase (NADPH)